MGNRRRVDQRGQRGAAMVEFAISILLFLLIVFGIIEFALLVFAMARANELTRDLSRMAIISDPVCDIFDTRSSLGACDGGNLNCIQGGTLVISIGLDDLNTNQGNDQTTGDRMLERAQQLLTDIDASQIEIEYACPNAANPPPGNLLRPQPVPLVTVRLQSYTRYFLLPRFLGLDAGFDFPAFEVSRLGEDLFTED